MEFKVYHNSTTVPYEELSALIKDAFTQRNKEGLLFSCRNYSAEDIRKHLGCGYLIVASENNTAIGMLMMIIKNRHGITYNTFECLAVSPKYSGKGIASQLFSRMIDLAKEKNSRFIISSTAITAHSSIKVHIKQGFNKFLFVSFPSTNYYSCCFIYPIKRLRIFNSSFVCTLTYSLSSFYTKLFKKK